MKKTLIMLICSFLCISMQAQTREQLKNRQNIGGSANELEDERIETEIATNIYPWIFSSKDYGGSILIRYNATILGKVKDVYRGYRLKIGFNSTDTDTLATVRAYKAKTATAYLQIGYEYQHQRRKWQLFYGSDLVYRYNYAEQKTGIVANNNIIGLETQTSHGSNIGVAPLIGVKYFVFKHLAISLESNVFIYFNTADNAFKTVVNGNVLSENTVKDSGFNTQFSGITILNVSVLF